MTEAQRYSHIKVSDADDDIVIQAGAVGGPAPRAGDAPAPAPAPDAAPAPEAAPAPAGESRPAPRAPKADAYRETTLEDLESSKMGTAQKAVIVLAVLGVIAFAVWYCLLR